MALTAEFTFSQFQRLEVHDQGRQGVLLLGSFSLACWGLLRPHRVLCLCTRIPGISFSSYKRISHLESELPLASFSLHYFFKGPFILQSCSQVLGIRASIYEFWGLCGWHSSVPTSSLGRPMGEPSFHRHSCFLTLSLSSFPFSPRASRCPLNLSFGSDLSIYPWSYCSHLAKPQPLKTCLVIRWLRIRLPMQGTQVGSLV